MKQSTSVSGFAICAIWTTFKILWRMLLRLVSDTFHHDGAGSYLADKELFALLPSFVTA
jgi:hypothetical protein